MNEEIAKALHYPECWDTAAYPTLDSAVLEVVSTFACHDCIKCDVIDYEAYGGGTAA